MRILLQILQAVFILLLLVLIGSAGAQKKPKMTPAEILAAAKPGQWVKMEGVVQKDFTVLTMDVKILTGDFLEDDWSITAVVRSIDPDKEEFKMLLLPVKTQKVTEYKAKRSLVGTFQHFADLKDGMLVEVDGTYQKDGIFFAVEIEDKSADLVKEPGLENEVEAVGRVEKVNVAKRTMTVMGITFQFTNKTEGEYNVK
jgi:hypothetical protein